MKFAPLLQKIKCVSNEALLRSCFMESVGDLVGATAWGLDLLDSRCRAIESDLCGLPDSFRDRYQEVGRSADTISAWMIRHHLPAHNLSMQSELDWQQSTLYQQVFRAYDIEHGAISPLVGNGRIVGGIYFMRRKDFPAFSDRDLIQLSSLCQHLSVRLANLRLPSVPDLNECLTPRELDIVELVAQGLNNREIAMKLYVSRDAIKQSLKRVFRKLDVSARAEMVAKWKQPLNE